MPKVIVGMSGGVDSSVTAYLLKEQGYEVEGLSFILWEAKSRTGTIACCSLHAMGNASKAACHIGIQHSIIDVRNNFLEKVIKPFVNAYSAGLTPNPCILCNRFIKFPSLMKEAKKRGAEYISTGHYARVERIQKTNNDMVFLKKGIDPKKDQSYVLYVLKQEELKRLILPLGHYRKDEVRKIAQELNLPAAKMAESQEICFIESRNYLKFIERLSSVEGKPGPIVNMTGKEIGTHKGIYGYTIGQRKGLGISFPEPLYVVKIDVQQNIIYAGPREAVKKREFFVTELNWINPTSLCFLKGGLPEFRCTVKVRSTMRDEPATIFSGINPPSPPFAKGGMGGLSKEVVHVVFDKPQWAPAPGQSAVFYGSDILIGGGVII